MILIPRPCIPSQLLPFNEAKKVLLSSFEIPENCITVQVADANGLILDQPVHSKRTNPPCLLAGPDGIAVKSAETVHVSVDNQIELQAPKVNTGIPVPDGYDAVIPIEEITVISEDRYLIYNSVAPFENTIQPGIDIVQDDLVLDTYHFITPFDISALLSYGITEISVKNWKIGLVATGDEVISPYEDPAPGQIVDTNSYMISAFLKKYGITPIIYPIIKDEPENIADKLKKMSNECDMVLIFGGSSAGSKDYTVDALEQCGNLLYHGVGIVPGKPVTLAKVDEKPVIGMPGPSVASLVILHELITPLLQKWKVPIPHCPVIQGILTEQVPSIDGFDMFLMVKVHKKGKKTFITPIPRIFGYMMGVRADAILHKKAGTDTYIQGQVVEVRMLRDMHH